MAEPLVMALEANFSVSPFLVVCNETEYADRKSSLWQQQGPVAPVGPVGPVEPFIIGKPAPEQNGGNRAGSRDGGRNKPLGRLPSAAAPFGKAEDDADSAALLNLNAVDELDHQPAGQG